MFAGFIVLLFMPTFAILLALFNDLSRIDNATQVWDGHKCTFSVPEIADAAIEILMIADKVK